MYAHRTYDITSSVAPGQEHLLPAEITADWLTDDLERTPKTIKKYRLALLKYCPAYLLSAVCRYPGGYAAYEDKQAHSRVPISLDPPPYAPEEALILRAFAYLVLTQSRHHGCTGNLKNARTRDGFQRAVRYVQANPDFWRGYTSEHYYAYKKEMRRMSSSEGFVPRRDPFPLP